MPRTEPCPHCQYAVPHTASTCPGCGRRHPVDHTGEAALAPPRRSRLLHAALRARGLCVLSVWVALAFGLASLARFVAGFERVGGELDEDATARLTTVAERTGMAVLVAVGLVIVTTALWARRCRRNVPRLGLREPNRTAWSMGGWLVPGPAALAAKLEVDAAWRDGNPSVAPLPGMGWSRQPISRVVLRWWSLWLWVPAVAVVLLALVGPGLDHGSVGSELRLAGVAAAAAVVANARALYDVIGIVTAAQAHRAEDVRRAPAAARSIDDELTAASTATPTA